MLNERKLTPSEQSKREDIIQKLKKNKRELVKRYGKDAEKVMYGRATNLAKKQTESMDQDKLREMIKDALQNPKKADLNKDGKLSDYEKKRGAAIEKNMKKVDEMDINDPVLMKMRAAKMKTANAGDDGNDKFFAKNAVRLRKLKALKDKRAEIMSDMEQEAEIEGGPIADRYGDMLNKIDKAIAMLQGQGKGDEYMSKGEIERRAAMIGLEEAFLLDSDIEDIVNALGYSDIYRFFEDNPGAVDAIYDWVKTVPEYRDKLKDADLKEDLDLGHQDNEPHMLKADLYRIGKYAMELYQMVDRFEEGSEEVDFPHWWQSKVIKAKDALVGAKHYLDFELKEPQIDAMVDVAQDVEAIDEAKYTDYSNNELAAYVKNNPNDKTAAAELKKRSQKLKDLSRTDIKEAVGKFVVRPCSAKDTPWAVWQTSKDGENDKRIKGFKTKEDAKKFADEKNSLAESLNEDKFSLLKGASKQTIARDTEESDREYIATRQKRDKISQKMYGKDYRELDSRQKDKVNQLRRQSSQFESVNEESTTFKKGDKVTYLGYPAEITFVGKDQMGRIYYSVSYDKGQGRTKASNLYNKGGEIKPLDEVTKSQMLKKAKKGSYPATLVAIENGKVVAQEKVNTPQEAPAAHSVMSKKYPNANIRLEDSTGKILKEMMSLDDKAKAYYLAKIKNGEIDTLPEDPKAAFLAQMTKDQMDHDKETLRRERGLEEGTLTPSLSITNPIKEFATKLAKQLKENND